jgi:hypothetical protein
MMGNVVKRRSSFRNIVCHRRSPWLANAIRRRNIRAATYGYCDHQVALQRVSRALKLRPIGRRLQLRQIGQPFGIVQVRAAQPASLEAVSEQDGIHLSGE